MWIHFGMHKETMKVQEVEYLKCPNCKESGYISFCIISGYFHIYFAPTIPLFKKTGFAYCDNCDSKFWREYMPPMFQEEFDKIKKEAKYPIRYYTMSIFIICIIILGITAKNWENNH